MRNKYVIADTDSREKVEGCLRRFLDSSGRAAVTFDDQTDLVRTLGLSSDEGLDLVLDLCDEFAFEFPGSFNPVVDDKGQRGRKVGELIQAVAGYLRSEKARS